MDLKPDRRALLASAVAGVGIGLLPRVARAKPIPPAPVARVEVVKDTYFGETLSDPYRWMENDQDPDWLPFLKGQNAHTRAILDALPGRESLAARIAELSGEAAATRSVQRAGGRLFFEQRPVGADNFRLYLREAGADRVLIDPVAMSGATGHVSLDWWRASPDGAHVVYGLSRDGSEDSVLHILDVAGDRGLPETIPNTQGGRPQWLDDGSGFFYKQLTGAVGTPERFLDAQARFHRLDSDPANDPILVKRGLIADLVFDRTQDPIIATFPGSDHAVLILADVREEVRILVAPLANAVRGPTAWTPVAAFEDEVTDVEVLDGWLYLVANHGAPRGRVLKTPLAAPDLAKAVEVIPQGPRVIEALARARDGLYITIMDGGVSRLAHLAPGGGAREIALPFDGAIQGLYATPAEDGALIALTGWLTPEGIWSVGADGALTDTGLNPRPAIDVSAYATTRAFAAAKDGVEIPYTLIHRQGLVRDGRNPAWISAYGSYGIAAYTPAFAGRLLALVDAGFVVGFANVRGGGEFGREWHRAGQLANKPNTWRDLIAVCETLIAEKVTAPERLAIGGRSAGGITVGRAMTERPDLFAAVIDGVGWSNPLRYVAEQNGYGEEAEWGAIADPDGYRYLKAIDSYQAVRDGVAYPAVLLTTGVTDPRVAPFHVGKMTARLQAATASGKPILLRVDFDAGHGIGSTRSQQDREATDTYAFLLWRTGAKPNPTMQK
jgi:prolyl oligopeptidase